MWIFSYGVGTCRPTYHTQELRNLSSSIGNQIPLPAFPVQVHLLFVINQSCSNLNFQAMKKKLLSLALVSLLGSSSFSQDVDSIWRNNPAYEQALSVLEANDLIVHSGMSSLISNGIVRWTNRDSAYYKNVEVSSDGELTVEFERISSTSDFYGGFTADWSTFRKGNGKKFGAGADTLYGHVWDATQSDVVISAEYKLDVSDPTGSGISTAQCRADIADANGRISNQSLGDGSVVSGDLDATGEWTPIEWHFSDLVYDQYTGNWWELNPNEVPVNGSTVNFRTTMTYVPLNMTRIVELAFIVDHGATSADKQPVGKQVTFTFRNMCVGDCSFNVELVGGEKTAEDLGIYPIPASDILYVPGEASISNILGQKVASGFNSVDVSELPAGMYTVTVKDGSATIMVD